MNFELIFIGIFSIILIVLLIIYRKPIKRTQILLDSISEHADKIIKYKGNDMLRNAMIKSAEVKENCNDRLLKLGIDEDIDEFVKKYSKRRNINN